MINLLFLLFIWFTVGAIAAFLGTWVEAQQTGHSRLSLKDLLFCIGLGPLVIPPLISLIFGKIDFEKIEVFSFKKKDK